MSSNHRRYSTSGFENAAVSKALLGCILSTYATYNVPFLAHLRHFVWCRVPELWRPRRVAHVIAARMTFVDLGQMVCAAVLVYHMRVLERRCGGRRFASQLVVCCALSCLLETAAFSLLAQFNDYTNHWLPCGPFCLIFPLLVDFCREVPGIDSARVFGVLPLSGKLLVYLAALQMSTTSSATVVTCLCAIISGVMYRCLWAPWLRRWLLPASLCHVVASSVGRLVASTTTPPSITTAASVPMGATLEVQRMQRMDELERRLLQQHRRDDGATRHNTGDATTADTGASDSSHGQIEVSEDCVQQLVDMGFARDQVVMALRAANNNTVVATTLLLQRN